MSTLMKRIFLCIIGILAGIAAWSVAELILLIQHVFPTYLFFSIFLGGIFGVFVGAFFSSSQGIFAMDNSKLLWGMITGAVLGIAGGVMGFLIGQGALFVIGEYLVNTSRSFSKIALPLSRSIGWAILGIFIGSTEGIRSRSLNKLAVGILGGLLGGIAGGLIVEYIRLFMPNMVIARFIGLLVFGLSIGFFYGLVEKKLSYGVLRLLNGKYKGKEYLINQKRTRIGSLKKNDINLIDYEYVDDKHAELIVKKNNVYIKNISIIEPAQVNDEMIDEEMLKLQDVIKIGNAKFLYRFN